MAVWFAFGGTALKGSTNSRTWLGTAGRVPAGTVTDLLWLNVGRIVTESEMESVGGMERHGY